MFAIVSMPCGITFSTVFPNLSLLGYLLAVSGAAAHAFYTLSVMGRPKGLLAQADPLISLSAALMVVVLIINGWLELSRTNPFYREGMLQLALFGPPASMVFGVTIKTLHFRLKPRIRKNFWWIITPSQLLTAISALAAVLTGDQLYGVLSSASFFASSILWIYSVDAFRRISSGAEFSSMSERDRTRYLYFSTLHIIASAWLLTASALGLLASLIKPTNPTLWYVVRDGFIHTFNVGFIGNMILAYAPVILPALLTGRAPHIGLSYLPAILLNGGNIMRVAVFLAGITSNMFFAAGVSSLYVAAVVLTLVMMHRLR
jgi:hypothetical protein